ELEAVVGRPLPTHADVLEAIDSVGEGLMERLATADFAATAIQETIDKVLPPTLTPSRKGKGGPIVPSPVMGDGEGRGDSALISRPSWGDLCLLMPTCWKQSIQ